MPQALWTGFIGFGLVNVPVSLHTATEDRSVRFNQLRRGTSHRVRYKRVDEVTGEELSGDEIVRGYATGEGSYVVLTDEELAKVAPRRSQEIAITDFVDLAEVDPAYFQRTYYLAPRTPQAAKAYALLREAMRRQNRAGIATLVLRDKEHLVAVRAAGEALCVETLFFADELRPATSVLSPDGAGESLGERELAMAEQLVASLSAPFEPDRYHDAYRERVLALIEAKRTGVELVVEEAEPRENVIDLVAALEASLARTRTKGGRSGSAPTDGTPEGSAPDRRQASPSRRTRSRVQVAEGQQAFEGMSRAELLALAADHDLEGRSRMTKLQLVQALRAELAAGSPPRQATLGTRAGRRRRSAG